MSNLVLTLKAMGQDKYSELIQALDPSGFGASQGLLVIKGVRESLLTSSEGDLIKLENSLVCANPNLLLEAYGGLDKVMAKQVWPCFIPGITNDLTLAQEFINGAVAVANDMVSRFLEKA